MNIRIILYVGPKRDLSPVLTMYLYSLMHVYEYANILYLAENVNKFRIAG